MAERTSHDTGGEHGNPRDKEASRQRLLDAAEAVFAEKGYHGAIVDDIIQRADMSKGGFYFHFPNKQSIFLALLDALVPKLAAAIERAISGEEEPVRKLDAALRTVLETFARHRRLSKILLVEAVGLGHGFDERLLEVRARFAMIIRGYLDQAVSAGVIAPLDTELTSVAWFGALNEVVVRWLVSGQPTDLESTFPALRALLLRSVGVDPAASAQQSASNPSAWERR